MLRSVLVLVAMVAVVAAAPPSECSYPCPTGIIATPICGKQINADVYHTFSSQCVIDCHAAQNPSRAYQAISSQGTRCSELGHSEVVNPIEVPSEFDFPYAV